MVRRLNLRAEAIAEAARLRRINTKAVSMPAQDSRDALAVSLVRTRSSECPAGVIFFARARIVDAAGRLLEDTLVAVRAQLNADPRLRTRRDVRAFAQRLVDRHQPMLTQVVHAQAADRATGLARLYGRDLERALAREQQIADRLDSSRDALVQAGLFDRRWLDESRAIRQRREEALRDSRAHADALKAGTRAPTALVPEIVLALIVVRRA